MRTASPGIEAICAIERRLLTTGDVSRWARAQLGVVRALVDEVDRCAPHVEDVRSQLRDELARLVRRLAESGIPASEVIELVALQRVA